MSLVSALDQARWSLQARRTRRRAAAAAATAAGLLLVTGCHVPLTSGSSAAGPAASGTVTVVAPPGVADAPLYIGIKDGFFSSVGLHVRVVPSPSVKAALAALRSGHANVAFGDYADMFYAQEQKPPHQPAPHLLVIADGYDAGPNVVEILTLPGTNITSPSALPGERIGTAAAQEMPVKGPGPQGGPRPFSTETVAAWSVLTGENVDPSKIRWIPTRSSLLTALETHQVDAILATEPTIFEAESKLGAVPVLDAATGATANLPLAGYFTNSTYASQHADVVTAFRAALERAQAEGTMAAPVQSTLTKEAGLNPQAAALVTVGEYPTTLSALNMQRVADLMFSFNALPNPLTVSSMVAK
jgi:NitT/TauT family transport system substrate-binding protein